MTTSTHARSTSSPNLWALAGLLFALLFIAGDILRGQLATGSLPLPSAPAEAYARYASQNQLAVLAVGFCQALSALALFGFVAPVVARVRSVADKRKQLIASILSGGLAAAAFLLVCALLGLLLVPVAANGNLTLLGGLRQANFLTGGTLHVAALGVFIGAASFAARRDRTLPRWLIWLGLVQSVIAILSLASLFIYYANAFILFGRLLGFVWCIAAGLVLAFSPAKRSVRA